MTVSKISLTWHDWQINKWNKLKKPGGCYFL